MSKSIQKNAEETFLSCQEAPVTSGFTVETFITNSGHHLCAGMEYFRTSGK